MTRLTMLFLVAVLVVPGAAAAAPSEDRATSAALATEAYYSSYGEPEPLTVAAPAPVSSAGDGPSWFGAIAIGAGLMLLAGGLGVYAGRTVRPRGLGA
jgi:hypothetical protein